MELSNYLSAIPLPNANLDISTESQKPLVDRDDEQRELLDNEMDRSMHFPQRILEMDERPSRTPAPVLYNPDIAASQSHQRITNAVTPDQSDQDLARRVPRNNTAATTNVVLSAKWKRLADQVHSLRFSEQYIDHLPKSTARIGLARNSTHMKKIA
jgi:hypothetical protein